MNALAGTWPLLRLIVRRDWLPLLAWVAVVALAPIGIAASAAGLYTTPEALRAYGEESMHTPAAVAMLGPVYSSSLGGLVAWRTGLQSVFLIAPVSILFVIRHTRTEEAKGRRELVGGAGVGRQAPLVAALAVAFGTSLLMGGLIAAGLIGLGLPMAGAVNLGLAAAGAGCLFAALAGVAAQLAQSAGGARGIAFVVFVVLYLVRAAGDTGGPSWLTWLSPIGWLRHTRAFAGEQWWVFLLLAGLAAMLVALAWALGAGRDLGAGLLRQRLGPAAAAPTLRSPLGLAWRLQRGQLLLWAAGYAVLGSLLGAVGPNLAGFVNVPQVQDWVTRTGARDAGEAFLFTLLYVLGQVVSAYAIMAALQLRSEEAEGRAEPALAAAVSRLSWASSHLVFAAAGSAVILAVLGVPVGLVYGLGVGEVGAQSARLLVRTLAALPAVWVMAGLATALYGVLPRQAWFASWAVLVLFLFLELGWELGLVSQAVFNVSPFAHVHWTTDATPLALAWLTAIGLALGGVGLVGLRCRDVG